MDIRFSNIMLMFQMSFHSVTAASVVSSSECERRLLVWALDWTRQAAEIEDEMAVDDKVGGWDKSMKHMRNSTVISNSQRSFVQKTAHPIKGSGFHFFFKRRNGKEL